MRTILTSFPFLCLCAVAPTQDLRRGLVDADAVLVARGVARSEHADQIVVHKLQVLRHVRGAADQATVSVIEWPQLGMHQRPTPRQSRLYCLQDATAQAARLELPAGDGPYYQMVGWAGCNPLVGAEVETDPVFRFAALLAASDAGAPPAQTAAALTTTALQGAAVVRTEAARLLAERPDLRSHLGSVQWSQLVSRAAGEIDDVPHKIALAELCAEQRLDGLLDALAVSLGQVQDADYARTVGRIGKLLHGEAATARLEQRLASAGQPQDRAALLLAIGATNTESALQALLRRNELGHDPAVEAALREHRSPRAKEAVARRKQ
jgi:hypothetical protein